MGKSIENLYADIAIKQNDGMVALFIYNWWLLFWRL